MRLPLTLWRMILGDLFRLIGVSAAVLVSVIAFAGAVKPLSDGVLDGASALKYILYAVPPMLAYALPFASGFGATLVYYRIAQDNEATAAHAGGISHRSLLIPAVIAGVLLAGSLALLNEQVIPRFLREMQRMVTVDIARWIAQEVSKGRSVDHNEMMIYADRVERLGPDPQGVAIDQLLMLNFAAVQIDQKGEPMMEVTASEARLWLMPPDGSDEVPNQRVIMQLRNVVGLQQGRGLGGFDDRVDLAWTVPNAFRDNVKFLTYGELRRVTNRPESINWVDARRRALVFAIAERRTVSDMQAALQQTGRLTLTDTAGRPVVIYGSGLTWNGSRWSITPPAGRPLRAEWLGSGPGAAVQVVAEAARAYLENDLNSPDISRRLNFTLRLERARTRDATETGDIASAAERQEIGVGPLRLPSEIATTLLKEPIPALARAAAPWMQPDRQDPAVMAPLTELTKALTRLERDALAKRHERMAMAVSCAVMIVTGAVTALRFTRSLPLTVYLWTFFPALFTIVTISGGQQVIVQVGPAGLYLMWGGVVLLAAYALVMFRSLVRH